MNSRPAPLDRIAHELGLALPAGVREQVAHEQLRMVLTHTRFGTLAATLFAMLMAWQMHGTVSPAHVQAWVIVKLAVAAARIALAQAYQRYGGDSARWQRWTLGMLALDGLVWGVAGFRLMSEPITTVAVVVAALDAVTCVATFGLQVRVAAVASYGVPILSLTALGLALREDEFSLLSAAGELILLALVLLTATGTSRRLAAGMLLRLQWQTLAEQKEAALRLAEQQSAARSQFLAKVSHELRTPLHGILGLARLMHLQARAPSVRHHTELIESSGTHLLGLINDLLDVSRIEAGRFALRNNRFDLVAQIDQVAEVFRLRAVDKGLAFRLDCTLAAPHWVVGDAARLRQVLHNLLGNAIKFTQVGEIALEVSHDRASGRLRLAVHDTGPGIDEAERARIFQAFHQAEAQLGEPTDGVGLGLTIAHEIAQAMRGDITVHSRPGEGSVFVFRAELPAAADDAIVRAAEAAEPEARLPSRVLVAEDDDVNALIVCAFLDQLGVSHERVANGKQAVGRALRETDRPTLVLMDCRMPEMDGLTATREIRAQERALRLAPVPVIALTATASENDRVDCLAAGMDEMIAKPFSFDQLAQALRRHGR